MTAAAVVGVVVGGRGSFLFSLLVLTTVSSEGFFLGLPLLPVFAFLVGVAFFVGGVFFFFLGLGADFAGSAGIISTTGSGTSLSCPLQAQQSISSGASPSTIFSFLLAYCG